MKRSGSFVERCGRRRSPRLLLSAQGHDPRAPSADRWDHPTEV